MSKPRSPVADFLVYLAVRILVLALQTLSFATACRFAGGLAWLAYRVDGRHRRVADDNLRHAFPELDGPARDQMVRAVYRHFCLLLVEIIFTPRLVHLTNWKEYFHLPGERDWLARLLTGRPALCVTGHFGNWEISGHAIALLGFPPHAIARPLDNPYLDRFLRDFRERTGQKILAKKGDFDKMEQVLASGGLLGTLADQDAGRRGLFVDFFGRPASTHKAIALMALEHNVLMIVGGAIRAGGPLNYHWAIADVIDPLEYRMHADPVRAITQRFTTALERLIRRCPEQYFWLHRRWKHQPALRKARVA
jgi:KDO2-lipid IV(A) lauroyltransferase